MSSKESADNADNFLQQTKQGPLLHFYNMFSKAASTHHYSTIIFSLQNCI